MITTLLASALISCPDLSGTFNCPAYGTHQPASLMSVYQTETAGVTSYEYVFDFNPAPSFSRASPNGLIDAGMLKFCSATTLYLGTITGTSAGAVQSHFLNENGDYVVIRGGTEVMHCTKSSAPAVVPVPTPTPTPTPAPAVIESPATS
jgi:hypothetical protein